MKTVVYTLALCVLCVGCSSVKRVMREHEQNVISGNYTLAREGMLQMAEKENRDELLWRLMTGNSYAMEGQGENAITQFDIAEDIFIKNDNASALGNSVRSGLSILENDTVFPYNSSGQDRIFCCLYKAIEYAGNNKMDAARTELNRAYNHQENWLFERKAEIAADEAEMEKAAAENANKEASYESSVNTFLSNDDVSQKLLNECGYDVKTSGNLMMMSADAYCNAYLAHFCGIFRWANGDGGTGPLKDAARVHPNNPEIQEDYKAASSYQSAHGKVWIYIEDGLAPWRDELRIDLPLFLIPYLGKYAQYAAIAVPKLCYRDANVAYQLTAGNQQYHFNQLENIDRLAKTEYDVFMRGAIRREILRCVTKVSAQVALGVAANNVSDSRARLILQLTQLGTSIYTYASTEADTRCWSTLPKQVWMRRIPLPQDRTIAITGGNSNVTVTLANDVKSAIIWLRKPSFQANFTTRVIVFR